MYHLLTPRLILTVSHPKLTKYVYQFKLHNRDFFAPLEPARSSTYFSLKETKAYLREENRLSKKCNEFRFWISEKGSRNIIGSVCLSTIIFGSVKSCFLSYKISYDKQGMGYATEAVQEVIDFAFNILRLHRIECYVLPSNTKSLRIMDKLNFYKEGVSRQCLEVNGVWQDHLRFAMITPIQY